MNARLLIGFLGLFLLLGCDPTAAPSSSTQSGPPIWPDAGTTTVDAGARDAGTDAGTAVDAGTDAGTTDAGMVVTADAGVTVISSNNRLPPPWTVSDARLLVHTQPLDGGVTPGLMHVGQLVTLAVSTTSDNTVVDNDHCPDIFSGVCDGFAAKDSASNLVLVDSFVLLGTTMSACSGQFNGATLSSISGIWAGRLLADMTTTYSIGLASCAGVGMGTPYTGVSYAPATTDIQTLQQSYPTGKPMVTVHGVVTAVQTATKVKTIFVQDPGGGAWSGIQVFAASGFATTPLLGDYVTVTATADVRGDYNQLVLP